MIERLNLETVYFTGMPNQGSVRGFCISLSPGMELTESYVQEVMGDPELPGLSTMIARVTFDESRVTKLGDSTSLYAGSSRHWYGLDGSPWSIRALESFNGRIDFILRGAGLVNDKVIH